jgi:hypothetical protein
MTALDRRQADRESILLYIRLLILDALGAEMVLDASAEASRLAAQFAASDWSEQEIAMLVVERAKVAGVAIMRTSSTQAGG